MNGRHRTYCPACDSRTCACGSAKTRSARACRACRDVVNHAASVAVIRPYTCEGCGKAFGRRKRSKDALRFCSNVCAHEHPDNWRRLQVALTSEQRVARVAARRAHVAMVYATPVHCHLCGSEFIRKSWNQKFCGSGCRRRADSKRTWPRTGGRRPYNRKAPPLKRYCVLCRVQFHTIGPGKYCTVACRERAMSDRRRTRKIGVRCEPVGFATVTKRDAGVCHICGEPTLTGARVPHPLAPTLDHVVPLSKGGDHTLANVKLAHFKCNCAKSDRLMEELAGCA